jgi:predicted Zn-ribbon and HTH transcriptional regulator
MDESQKKNLMIGIIVVCIIVAGYLVYANFTSSGDGINSIPGDEMVWVKCTNKSCQAEFQMKKKQYYEEAEEVMRKNPMASFTPVKCEKCGNTSALLAEKCPYCETVFITDTTPNDFPDRCPKCKKSATEESRNERKKAQGGQ